MRILGINAFHGDAAAALVVDGSLVAAVAEERLNRKKHCAGFPHLAIQYCLKEGGLRLEDLDHIGISRNPWANFHRRVWYGLRRFLSPNLWKSLGSIASVGGVRSKFGESLGHPVAAHTQIHHLEHHLTHAASAFFVSPFDRAAILTLDGFGDFSSGLLGIGKGTEIQVLRRIHFPHSLGIYYTALTQYLGFPHYGDEGKVMALATLGKPKYLNQMQRLLRLTPSGLVQLGLEYFTHHTKGVAMTWGEGSPTVGTLYSEALPRLLGPPRQKDDPLTEHYYDVAASMQLHLEEIVLKLIHYAAVLTGETRLCLAGGVALNSVVNGRIRRETPFQELFIQPGTADDGTAIGAAFYIQHQLCRKPRSFVMNHAYWGPSCSNAEFKKAIEDAGLRADFVEKPECAAADAIASGKVVGWFQGRMEFGPRALGNRSILADPGRPEMKQLLNERVKHRENFRPFAPSLLEEDAGKYFDQDYPSPYMLLVYKARPEQISKIPGALHVDQTGRLQTVTNQQNTLYYSLLLELKKRTGHGIVVNTSFNDSEPIVCTPENAIHCFLNTRMDMLFLGNYQVRRSA